MSGNGTAESSLMGGFDDGESEGSVDIGRFIGGVRKRWWLIVLTTAIAVGLAFVYTARQPREYLATAHLVIDTSTNQNILSGVQEVVQLGTGGYWASEAFYAKEYRIIRSRRVARLAGEALSVTASDELTGLAKITDPVERAARRAELDPADFVLGVYSVTPAETANIVAIEAIHQDREFARDVANAVADAYVQQNGDKRLDGTRQAGSDLQVQYAELRERHETSENELYAFLEKNGIFSASLESQQAEVLQRLRAFNAELAIAQAEGIRGRSDDDLLNQIKDDPRLIDSIAEVRSSAIVSKLKASIADLYAQQTELSARYQAAHPKMQAIEEKMRLLRVNLDREIDSILTSLNRARDAQENIVGGLRQAIREERTREARLNQLAVTYNRKKREVDANAHLLEMVEQRMKEAGLSGAFTLNNTEVIEPAQVPGGAYRPSYKKNLSIAGFLGLMLGLVISIVLVLLDNTVRGEDDIQSVFPSVPFLGVVPIIETDSSERGAPSKDRDLFVAANPKSSAAEAIRFIRTNLMFMSPDKPLKTLLVTSPLPREGKTMTAINIAVTMAQQGGNAVIIDCDMRRPRLHRAFGLQNTIGLSSCIAGDKTIDEVAQQTRFPGLQFIACGPVPPNPSELLHNKNFNDVLQALAAKYDRVIIDSPPVNAVADPVIIGTQVDGTIMVMHHSKTTKLAARRAIGAMLDANAPLFGFILNDVNVNASRYAGGYYGGYYRNYAYYSETQGSET